MLFSTITKNVVNIANSSDPDETPRFLASHLGLRYLLKLPFWNFCINALTTSPQLRTIEFQASYAPGRPVFAINY